MNCRVFTCIGTLSCQTVECTDYLQSRLSYRFFEVTAGRGYRTADCNGSNSSVVQSYFSGSLIECRNGGLQICRECFFARDFFQTSGHFSHCLCPTAGGVGQEQYVQAHLSVILCEGYCGIARSLSGCYRHGGRVTNDNRSLHHGTTGLRVFQFREFLQNFYNLAGTLSTGCHDNDVRFTVLRLTVLKYSLSCTERSRDTECSALCNRQECINCTELSYQRFIRTKSFLIALVCLFNRLCNNHAQVHLFTLAVFDHTDC